MGPRDRRLLPILAAGLILPAVPLLAQVPAGPEFRVNTTTTIGQFLPTVAREPDGDFTVAWMGQSHQANRYGIFAQRYDASGAPRGGEFRVNSNTTEPQYLPWVAADGRGRYVVVWSSGHVFPALPIDLVGRRYAPDGAPLGSEFRVTAYNTNGDQDWGRVAASHNGDFVVVWQDAVTPRRLTGQSFSRTGERLGEFLVTTVTTGRVQYPAIAVQRGGGGFVVAWMGPDGGAYLSDGIFARRFDAAGPVGAEFRVNTHTTDDQEHPSVAVTANGDFIVVWSSRQQDGWGAGIFGQRFAADGARLGGEFQVNTYTTAYQDTPSVDAAAAGDFVVAWRTTATQDGDLWGVMARRFAADGRPRSGEFIVNTYWTSAQEAPQVAVDQSGNFVIVWHSYRQDGSSMGVFAQRFGGLHPRALEVDPVGNRVLEPGERVPVRPSWQNLNGAAQTFTGALASVPDVSHCIHAVADGTADYGAVANGATALCTDCYVVSAGASTPRCRQHWDIAAVESISPEAQGQANQWRVHVGGSFTDVTPSPSYRFVETLFHHGLTAGCGANEFCPADATLRGQMAVFVLLASERADYRPPACLPPNMFDDVPETSPFCRWVEEAARRGIAAGCSANPPLFCPHDPVVRDQMSVLLLRTLDSTLNPPACVGGSEMFGDVPASSPFCRWIEELARRGVAAGCSANPPLFCPSSAVTREQMAVFLSATFGLQLYGP